MTTAPLTASLHNVAQSHDGSTVFTFELHFSEEFNLSYLVLRDYAFTVEGGTVTRATRIDKGVQHQAEDTHPAGRRRRRDHRAAHNHGLRGRGGHLHQGWTSPVQPAGAGGLRTGRIRARCVQGFPDRPPVQPKKLAHLETGFSHSLGADRWRRKRPLRAVARTAWTLP